MKALFAFIRIFRMLSAIGRGRGGRYVRNRLVSKGVRRSTRSLYR